MAGYDGRRLSNGSSAPTYDPSGNPVRVDPATGKVTYPSSVVNNGGRPDDPTMTTISGHSGAGTSTNIDPTGYDFLKNRLGSDNPWMKMQTQALDQQHGQAMNQNVRSTRNAMTGGMNQLAASGGFDAGSRERMARGVQSQGMLGAQGLAAGNAQNRLNLGIQNEQMQQNIAGQLHAMDTDVAKFNAQKLQMDNGNRMDIYNTKMTGWGANQTADAMAKGGGKK